MPMADGLFQQWLRSIFEMTPQETREATDLARRIDQNLNKIFLVQFGHVLTLAEWKALPIAIRRAIDKQARQQANHTRGNQ
jgi:hypothetical protein